MRLDEVNITGEDKELPFNVAEDLMVFMQNDPMFYRKQYFPCMSSMSDSSLKGREFDFKECARPMIQSAMESYCKKFKVSSNPQSIFTKEDEDAILEKMYEDEMPKIESGEY